jgi:hypothetical protein
MICVACPWRITELGSQNQSVTLVQGAAESPSQNFGEATGAQKLCAGTNSGECSLVILRSLTGRDREGKLANATIDGEYNLSGQELKIVTFVGMNARSLTEAQPSEWCSRQKSCHDCA